jgi:AmmeMemoRadiSam system protein B
MAHSTRRPFVAGKFYPDSATEIRDLIEQIKSSEHSGINYSLAEHFIYGAVLPHAGYIFSGIETIHFFEILSRTSQTFDCFVLLHPIHRQVAPDYACDASSSWTTPLGEVDLDQEFIEKSGIPISTEQQKWEHSAEVILPFIQYFISYPYRIVPVGISHQSPEVAQIVAQCIKTALDKTDRKICLIASSDFTHYVDPEKGKYLDQKVLDRIMDNDPEGIYKVIRNHDITVCGYGPIMSLMFFLKNSATKYNTTILRRGHSGEAHPSESVVDYISILFHS